jgi:DNA-binding transcriptional LysR family regulator
VNGDDLKVFLAIRRASSIKGAARALKVDHSTVSRRLAALEESLGARLFERTPEGLVATVAAQAIAPLAEQIDQLAHELQDAARAASDAPSGPVRIAVSPILAEQFLIPRVPELLRRFPGIELDVRADIARTSFVGEREADIAMRTLTQGRAPAEPSAVASKVGTLGFAVYASRAYVERHGAPERPLTSLAGHSVISTRGWFPNTWNDQLETPGRYALAAYPFASVLVAVVAGLGVALLPCLGADSDPRIVRVSDLLMSFDLGIVTSVQARTNPRIRAVKEALVELLREQSDELAGTVHES